MKPEHLEVWRNVKNAYCPYGATDEQLRSALASAHTLAHLVSRWLETEDTTFIDDAIEVCYVHGLPIKHPLLEQVVAAARHRNRADTKLLSRADREAIKREAFRLVANLKVVLGLSLSRASEIAAVWSSGTNHPLKASTIEKEYPRVGADPLEELLSERWQDHPDDEVYQEWQAFVDAVRPPRSHEKGERR
ncbi:hypothetical protein HKCCSP123_14125 [Rhodobacterales bacterium HKCCSP123]|nr:hypothetical protein [Rhodobacterales bacterium HKCCSP123]